MAAMTMTLTRWEDVLSTMMVCISGVRQTPVDCAFGPIMIILNTGHNLDSHQGLVFVVGWRKREDRLKRSGSFANISITMTAVG